MNPDRFLPCRPPLFPVTVGKPRKSTAHVLSTMNAAITILQRGVLIRAPITVTNGHRTRIKKDWHDRTARQRRSGAGRSRSGAGRNRNARRKLQSDAGKIPARALGIFCHGDGKCASPVRAPVVLVLAADTKSPEAMLPGFS